MAMKRIGFGLLLAVLLRGGVLLAADVAWTPDQWKDDDTLQLCTNDPGEGEYCFKVWLVVIDGNVYVRLGGKATSRVKQNTGGMMMPVILHDQRFERVRLTETPDFVERVNKAMAEKYASDLFVRFFSHPITARLNPEPAS
jgi:hypothetical protein